MHNLLRDHSPMLFAHSAENFKKQRIRRGPRFPFRDELTLADLVLGHRPIAPPPDPVPPESPAEPYGT